MSRHRQKLRGQRGSAMVEFLLVFPAFLVLCMFVLEVGLMWADRHVARLAAFEAARVFAAARLPETTATGAVITSPCDSPTSQKAAKTAALLKIAAISPSLDLYVARLGKQASAMIGSLPAVSPSAAGGDGLLARSLARIARRYPTAVVSTELACRYDQAKGEVQVDLTYNRMLQTPMIDRVMFVLHRLAKRNGTAATPVSFDLDFMGLSVDLAALGGVSDVKALLGDKLGAVSAIGLSAGEAANFLKGVPGIGPMLAGLPTLDVGAWSQGAGHAATTALQGAGLSPGMLHDTTVNLAAWVAMVPEALRTIPLDVRASVQRESFTSRVERRFAAGAGPSLVEKRWEGIMKGVMTLADQNDIYRKWAHEMSNPRSPDGSRHVDGGKPLGEL